MEKKRILLTGGKGFFCSRLADYYRDQYDFIITDKEELDITDERAVYDAVAQAKPEIIVHAGAAAVTDFCNQHPDIARRINVDAAVTMGRAAEKNGARMVFLSSEQVFNGNAGAGPFIEEDDAVPNTVYGENKLEAEGLLRDILGELWIVRFTWMFGLPERGKGMSAGILWDTMSRLMRGEMITASRREFRGMTYVYEMIENFPKLFQAPYGTYHMGSVNHESRYDIVKFILGELGLENRTASCLREDTEKYLDSSRDVRLDTSKAEAAGMHWMETKEALRKCIQEYRLG
ncbi:MAG: sugar nucleotide-binding protein [Eubacteriales bacterium]|nr:sugar nucleotide-binding protein [Eubacteriales bacterium]